MGTAPLVCLVTPGHLASTPRLLKEADSLFAAGYRVHVVASRHYAPVNALDETILSTARWGCTRVDFHGGPAALARKLFRRAARLLVRSAPGAGVRLAARAQHAQSRSLTTAVMHIRADLYIGHCLAALPAVALAARRHDALYGFDLEDFHDAETRAAEHDVTERNAIRILQTKLLPGCRHLTAAAPLIAAEYASRYRVAPTVVLNAFPRAQAPAVLHDPGPVSASRPARFYWFSQTVGPDRGLEETVAVLAKMRIPAELQLRGFVAPYYAAHLQTLAQNLGARHPIKFLPPGPPAEMVRLAADADIGLSAELRVPLNRDLCLTNKIFVYLLAGLPQLLSATAAQSALAPQLGAAALLANLQRPEETAARLDAFFADPAVAVTARRTAWNLAQRRYCWDEEQKVFLGVIHSALPPPR